MSKIDDDADVFWAKTREFEHLLALKVKEVGEGPELHQWLLDIEAWDKAVRAGSVNPASSG